MTGPNPILESLENEWDQAGRWTAAHFHPHRHHQTPAAQPATMAGSAAPAAKENTMSLLDTLKNAVADADAKLEGIDEATIAVLKRVMANPETAIVLKDLDTLAVTVGIPQGFISGTANGLKVLAAAYAPDPSQAQQQAPVPA